MSRAREVLDYLEQSTNDLGQVPNIVHSVVSVNPLALATKGKQVKDPVDFDAEELAKGIRIEMKHTKDPDLAREIAMVNLVENPSYYSDMEKLNFK